MRFLKLGFVTFVVAFVAIACAGSSPDTANKTQPTLAASPVATATPDELASARANFEKHCASCHGDRGEGGLVKVDDKKLKVPSLREGHAVTHPDDKLAQQITNGDDEMPAFKDKLNSAETNLLVKYIRKEFQAK